MYLKPSKARETLTLITSNKLSAKLINAVYHLFDIQIFQKRFLAINVIIIIHVAPCSHNSF